MTEKSVKNSLSFAHIKRSFDVSLKLASNFIGATYPNPAVGCCIVDKSGDILGIGCHERAGEMHAERDAIQIVESKMALPSAYAAAVTLEPCAHHGRTPPCFEAILKTPIKRVLIGMEDPTDKAGGGAKKLKEGGVDITFLQDSKDMLSISVDSACLALPFLSISKRRKPWVIVKQAINKDGNMMPPKGQKTFSSDAALQVAHLLRRSADTILTTTKTIEEDKPLFTVRNVANFNPDLPKKIIVLGKTKVCKEWIKGRGKDGFEIYFASHLTELDKAFEEAKSHLVLVEAGPTLLAALKQDNLWDEWLEISCKETEELKLRTSARAESFFEDDLGIPAGSLVGFLNKHSNAWPRGTALVKD